MTKKIALTTKRVESRFFLKKSLKKTKNDANTSRTYIYIYIFFFSICYFFQKISKTDDQKLDGNNISTLKSSENIKRSINLMLF